MICPLPRANDLTLLAGSRAVMPTEEVGMTYTQAAVERAVKVHEVLMQALSGRQPWIHVAEVLGVSARTVRRLRWRYEQYGFTGLYDHRQRMPSPRAVPVAEVQRRLALYRDRYGPRARPPGVNVRPFYQIARREHGVAVSYSFVKKALQAAGLVRKRRPRGRHRRRREPRPCWGEALHLGASRHRWLALVPDSWQTLLVVVDDATKRLLYAQLVDDEAGEGTEGVMTALWEGLETHGIPGGLHTPRAAGRRAASSASWGSRPRRAGGASGPTAPCRAASSTSSGWPTSARWPRPTAICATASSPITTPASLTPPPPPTTRPTSPPPPADPTSAFVPVGRHDLNQILCHEEERVVARDNTVRLAGVLLQIDKQRGPRSCASLRVLV